MNKSSRSFAKPLRDLTRKVVGEAFARQGFASAELVTRWSEIVGADIAVCCEPIKVQWPRQVASPAAGPMSEPGSGQEPATLILRVEGPAAIEIQHLAGVICERVNRFLGWRAVARIALRQAPLRGRAKKAARHVDPAATAEVAASLSKIADDDLRQALARLGASVKAAGETPSQ